jgi:histidinol dehydrogenase
MKRYINPDENTLLSALERPALEQQDLSNLVKSIFDDVNQRGDAALRDYALKFDGFAPDNLFVSDAEFEAASKELSEELKSAIDKAYRNIDTFHRAQQEYMAPVETSPGVTCWRKSVGIEKVGLYIPGGTAPLFSTVLMLGVPAIIAGCKEVILATPANKEGKINPAILYTASVIGLKKVVKLGGIQAIAALSLGTESLSNVYKIFGPGNQYVTAAKQYAQSLGIAIDMPAGPSEVMVVADATANPSFLAADLLSQAEHGADSQVVLVTDEPTLLEKVEEEVSRQLAELPRKELATQSLESARLIAVERNALLDVINAYAPEHLILNTQFNQELVDGIINAGSVFIGAYTPESLGDYASGTNHTLPTNGFARAYSGVSLDSFVRKITFQEVTPAGILDLGPTVEIMAAAEQLDAHKNAVTYRLQQLATRNP